MSALNGEQLAAALKQEPKPPQIYLDYNATAPLRPEALEAMRPFLEGGFGNPSSLHRTGQEARAALEKARRTCAGVLGCEPNEIVFTSGATESNNLALRGLSWARREKGLRILLSPIEHPSVREAGSALGTQGFQLDYVLPENTGVVSIEAFTAEFCDDTIVAALMYANNETGVVQPIHDVARVCRRKEIAFHVDAVQAVGRLPIDVKAIDCDTLALSAHKFEGPKGIGLLYVRRGCAVRSHMSGGSQENELRGGTQNVPGIVGMAEALRLAEEERQREALRLLALRERFEKDVRKRCGRCVVMGAGAGAARLANTSFVAFPGLEAEALVIALDLEGLAVSTGAACSEGTSVISPVLKSMQVPDLYLQGAVRFSFGRSTTMQHIETALEILERVVKQMKKGGR